MADHKFAELAKSYGAGDISDADAAALLDMCRSDAAMLQQLADSVADDRLMAVALDTDDTFAAELGSRLQPEEGANFCARVISQLRDEQSSPAPRPFPAVLLAIAAAVALVAGLALLRPDMQSAAPAVVARSVAAVWTDGPAEDGIVANGAYHLREGLAELSFSSGVTMIVEAPAAFTVESVERVVLHSGTVTARVPQGAEGFTVDSPEARIIDLGTEFAVSIQPNGSTEVHVLEGEVEAVPHDQRVAQFRLKEAEAARIGSADSGVATLAAAPHRFVRRLPDIGDDDPGFLYWNFDEGSGEVAVGLANHLSPEPVDARLTTIEKNRPQPSWIPGVRGSAIALDGVDDYLQTDFPGIGGSRARTVAFWVRVPTDWKKENGYAIVSWGSYAYDGATWQISANPDSKDGPLGRLRIGIFGGQVIGTTDLRDGEWHHMAVVMYGGETADVATHVLLFVDGELEPTSHKSLTAIATDTTGPHARRLMMGRNAALNDRGNRCFRGDLDELYIFDSALSQEAIRALMNPLEERK
jgi:hypothetical protein